MMPHPQLEEPSKNAIRDYEASVDDTEAGLMGKEKLEVVIVGGSLSGLMQGVMLKHHGHNVHIIEQTPRTLEAQAAGIGTGSYIHDFLHLHDRLKSSFAFPCKGMRTLDAHDRVLAEIPLPTIMTSWDALYLRLRANFDGLTSSFCPEPPLRQQTDGEAIYETGKRLVAIDEGRSDMEPIVIRLEDVYDKTSHKLSADLLIGADGANSTVRSLVYPSAPRRQYAGYVLWRGILPEQELNLQKPQQCSEWFSFYRVPEQSGLVIIYNIPGQDGSLKDGERGINFAWYSHVRQDQLGEILTDVNGHRHRWAVPVGKIDPKVWQRQLQEANVLSGYCKEVVTKLKSPFLQLISDCSTSRAAFYGGRVLLTGDALALMRPHTGTSISQGALHVLLLEKALFGNAKDGGIAEWERRVVEFARVERLKSISWGEWWIGGWSGWLPAAFKYHGYIQLTEWWNKIAALLKG